MIHSIDLGSKMVELSERGFELDTIPYVRNIMMASQKESQWVRKSLISGIILNPALLEA